MRNLMFCLICIHYSLFCCLLPNALAGTETWNRGMEYVVILPCRQTCKTLHSALGIMIICILAGCASIGPQSPRVEEVMRADPEHPENFIGMPAMEISRSVIVLRSGQPTPVALPMELRQGDEVEVRPPAIVTIRFPAGHEVVMQPNTRVRLGSIFQYVGNLIVRARGRFKVEAEYWTAGVKGTEFSVRLTPDQIGYVAVTDGSVSLTSRTSAWQAVEVRGNEIATIQRDGPPSKSLMKKAQIDAIRSLMNRPRIFWPRPHMPYR
ncbi:FecR domain-containing protein [Azotobacter sp. CWF10]